VCSGVSTTGADPGGDDATRGIIRTRGRARVRELSSTAFAGPVSALSTRYTNDERRDGWTRAVLEPLVIAAESGSAPSAVALRRLNALTVALQPHPEALELLIAAVRDVELELSAQIPAGSVRLATLQHVATDVLIAISRSCTRPLLARNGVLERTIGDQYEVDMDLLAGRGGSPRELAWLPAHAQGPACLGIWAGHETAAGEREIQIVGARGTSGSLARLVGERMPVSQFPPAAFTRSDSAIGTGLTFVIPVTTASRDWGLLAINGRVESHATISRERYNHWAALLAVALDQEELVDRLRTTERELTQAASAEHAITDKTSADGERLALWTQALELGTWDWDVSGGTVYYSPQWKRALGYADAEIGSSPAEWLDRIHPHDRPLLSSLIAAQLGGDRTPLRVEHRVRTASGGYRRMLCLAITVLDEAGCPSRIVGVLVDVTDCGDRERP
jgi:PAS domain S-box-containing protein